MPNSPFKFLDSYTRDDRHIFFGRDREVEELYHRVFESKLMLVYGISGTGKSSLIHCGLANKFNETDWLPLVIRRGGNIIESMAAGIKAVSITSQQNKFTNPADFKKGIRSLYLDHYKPVFFIFDQFEELFIFGDKEERRNFVQIVKSLIESDLQCRLIFVMREEYMAGITEFERYIPTFFANRVRIEKMSHINALETIKEPCKVFNISIEEGFAETLLEKLSPGSTEVELTYLQVFLDKIFRLAVNEKESEKDQQQLSFTLLLLDRIGNVSDLLGSFLDEQVSILDDPDTALSILKSLVSVQGTKRSMTAEEIAESTMTFGRSVDNSVLLEMLQTFINLRILRDRDENGKVELRHDALAVKIFEKFTLAEKELLEVRKYVENAYFTFEKRGLLLNRQDLDYLAEYDNKLILPQNLDDFVFQSKNKLQNQRRYLVRITRISAIIIILIIAAIGRYYLRTQQSSQTNTLISTELLQSELNPVKGIFLWEKDTTSALMHFIILNDFQNLITLNNDTSSPISLLRRDIEQFKLESAVCEAQISKEGKFIYGWMENNRIFIWSIFRKECSYFPAKGAIENIELSERDSSVALVYRDNTGAVCDFHGKIRYTFETTFNDVMNERLVCFFPSGDYQLIVAKENSALIYDKNGKIIFRLKGHTGRVNSVDVSPDGRFVATASSDKKIYLWNYNQTSEQMSIYDSLIGHWDTVWSCEFNKTGKYVITASADSMIKIWDLNGKEINPLFNFARTYYAGARVKTNDKKYDEDAYNPELSAYYRKFCNASFTENEREIIATGYTSGLDSLNNIIPIYNQVLYYGNFSNFQKDINMAFFQFAFEDRKTMTPEIYQQFIVSPPGEMAAIADNKLNTINILEPGGLRLILLQGTCPMFSHDGKEIFWIENSRINKIPVSPVAIKSLLEKFNISKSTKAFENILIVL
jgi:WD40 repeat protein